MITCCKNCKYQGCGVYHSRCPEYQRQKAEDAIAKEKKRNEGLVSGYIIDCVVRIRNERH